MSANKLKLTYYKNNVSAYFPKGEFQIKLDNEAQTPFLVAPIPLGGSVESVEERVKRVVECVNAMKGIEDPSEYIELAKQNNKTKLIGGIGKYTIVEDDPAELVKTAEELITRGNHYVQQDKEIRELIQADENESTFDEVARLKANRDKLCEAFGEFADMLMKIRRSNEAEGGVGNSLESRQITELLNKYIP